MKKRTSREKFEAWLKKRPDFDPDFVHDTWTHTGKTAKGVYFNGNTRRLWQTWQAATRRSAQ